MDFQVELEFLVIITLAKIEFFHCISNSKNSNKQRISNIDFLESFISKIPNKIKKKVKNFTKKSRKYSNFN